MIRKSITTHPVNGYKNKGLKKSFYSIPHYYMPGLNTYSMNHISTSDEAILHYSESDLFNLPVPCVNFFEIDSKINAVLDLVNLKTKWKFENQKLLTTCRKKLSLNYLNDLKNIIQMNEASYLSTLKTVPCVLTKFTLNLMEDPDKYFDSEYNWYFKNTMEKFQSNGKWYLVYARGENLNILDIITISDNKFETIYNKEVRCFEGPIYDIKSSNSNDLMIRQKTKIFLFRDNFEIDTFLNNDSIYDNNGVPLADADVSINNFCTVDVEHVIKLWKDGKCIQDKYFEIVNDQSDSFIHLSYLQDQTDVVAIIDRQKLYMIDTRIDISKPCSIYDPNIIIEQCEELTALTSSNLNSHSFYVASNHSVLTLDNRIGFAHKSYHMLSNPPSLITSHCYKNSLEPNEILFLGNQIEDGIISSSYTSFQNDFLSCQSIISSVPKPLDSLQKVRFQGHCLNPMLLDRLSLCLVGLTAFGENVEDLKLFSVNSVGDLFVQKLNDSTPINPTEFEKLVTVKNKKILKLNYSHVFDMSTLWKKELSNNCEEKINKNGIWSISKEKMTSYVDHLAPLILSPWDLDDLSEWEDVDAIDDFDCDYTAKVSYWFNKNDSLLESTNSLKTNLYSLNSILTKATTSKTATLENDKDSSSGYTVSLKSDSSSTLL